MLYLIDIIAGERRIADPEGTEFPDVSAARAQAVQWARDLAAEELRSGKHFPAHWSMEICDRFGNLCASVSFASLIVEKVATSALKNGKSSSRNRARLPGFAEHYQRSKAVF